MESTQWVCGGVRKFTVFLFSLIELAWQTSSTINAKIKVLLFIQCVARIEYLTHAEAGRFVFVLFLPKVEIFTCEIV